jgi:hypothetical protein
MWIFGEEIFSKAAIWKTEKNWRITLTGILGKYVVRMGDGWN